MVGRVARAAVLVALLVSVAPEPAHADEANPRGFTAGDLVKLEGFGGARIERSGRWVVWERRGPYDSAATYAYATLTSDLLTDLVVVDATGARPDRVIGADDQAGYRAGPISPDGRRMMVHRLTAGGRTLGVLTFETGAVAWLDVSVDLPVLGRTAAWRNDGEIVAVLTPEARQPLFYRLGWETQTVTTAAWATAQQGRSSTALQVWSGEDRDRRPQRAPGRLAAIRVDSGAIRVLAEGEFFDLEIAPGGDAAAVLENAEDVQPVVERLTIGDPTRRRRLRLVDLDSGATMEPLPDRDLMSHLLSWSADGDRLLVFSRLPGGDWSEGDFHLVSAVGRVADLDLGGDRPAVLRVSGERIPIVRGGWAGAGPAVLVETAEGRQLWRDIGSGQHVEADPFGKLVEREGTALFDGAAGLGPWGGSAQPGVRLAEDGSTADGGSRAGWNPVGVALATTVDAAGCLGTFDAAPPVCPSAPGRRAAASSGTAVFVETAADGRTTVRLAAQAGERVLDVLNPDLAGIDWGEVVEVAHPGVDGEPLRSWLLLPPGSPPAGGWPLLVMIYPGHVHPTVPSMLRPGAGRTQISPLVLAGAGYAVLAPSLPLDPAGDGSLADLAARIDRAVDVALARGGLDGDRLGLIGHSFGGRGVLIAGARTDRYRALIASAGMADYASNLRDTLHFSAVPSDGLLVNAVIGYFESGQGGMGALPWEAPAAYTAASPLYAADRIRTPMLLIRGDLDPVSAEAMFGALYRLNREASLITYRGEGHVLTSPANIVDLHARMIAWLDERLAPRSEPRAPAAEP